MGGQRLKSTDGIYQPDYDMGNIPESFQVIVFYPCDWESDSHSLLTSFSHLVDQLKTSQCSLYGCSTDSASVHQNWIKTEFGDQLNFPLISDPAGRLADKFCLYDSEERLSMRGVVLTDNQGNMLEVVTSSLESGELAQLTLGAVKKCLQQ